MIFREKLPQPNRYLKGKFPSSDNRAAATSQHPECNTLLQSLGTISHSLVPPSLPHLVVGLQPPLGAQVMPRAVRAMGYRAGRRPGCCGQGSRGTREEEEEEKDYRQLGSSRSLPPEPPKKGSGHLAVCITAALAGSRGACPALIP